MAFFLKQSLHSTFTHKAFPSLIHPKFFTSVLSWYCYLTLTLRIVPVLLLTPKISYIACIIPILFLLTQGGQKRVVAVKCIERKRLTNGSMENILTEIKLMKDLHHEHIVKLLEFEVSRMYMYTCTFVVHLKNTLNIHTTMSNTSCCPTETM